jgi:hypothetical protein
LRGVYIRKHLQGVGLDDFENSFLVHFFY